MNNKSLPTSDEIVSSIKRSFIPMIVIEGNDDVFVYRWLKSKIETRLISLQPCGGRNNLFKVYERRAEFSEKNVVFVADKDAYRFDTIPTKYSDIVFTEGYCIENDIFKGSRISEFLDNDKEHAHNLLREIIGKWAAFELDRYRGNNTENKSMMVSSHINVVSPLNLNDICPDFSRKIGYSRPSDAAYSDMFSDYNLNVRGKQLFQMLSRFLSGKGRFSNFSDRNLVEIALKQGDNALLDGLLKSISTKLNAA